MRGGMITLTTIGTDTGAGIAAIITIRAGTTTGTMAAVVATTTAMR